MRDLTAAMDSAFDADEVNIRLLAYFDFPSGEVRAWNGVGDLSYDGYTWTGLGNLAQIQPPDSGTDISAQGAVFTLSGIPSAYISIALSDDYQNRVCKFWVAVVESGSIIATPYAWQGRIDTIDIQEDGTTTDITLRAESRLVDLDKARERRWSDEDQQNEYPGDLGLEFSAIVPDLEIHWGVPNQEKTVPQSNGTPTYNTGTNNPWRPWDGP